MVPGVGWQALFPAAAVRPGSRSASAMAAGAFFGVAIGLGRVYNGSSKPFVKGFRTGEWICAGK